MSSLPQDPGLALSRRAFLGGAATLGLGRLALADTAAGGLRLHHAPRAKRVVFLCMAGGPSQLESFDEKPTLARFDGTVPPPELIAGQPIAQLQNQALKLWLPQFPFTTHPRTGQRVSEAFPHLARVADRLAIIRSLETDQINHDPAHTVMNTGTSISGRPSMGSWVQYGLGSESRDLPGFVVLTSRGGRDPQPLSTRQWGAGFLPGHLQGVELRSQGALVPYADLPAGVDASAQGQVVAARNALDSLSPLAEDPDVQARIQQYELAFRMQQAVPELTDLSREDDATLGLYGLGPEVRGGGDGSFAYNCLLARRLLERGVRFVQLYHRGWDHHNDLVKYMGICAGLTDEPAAGLLLDLERRGMLEETLVVWTGEFGRTPMVQTNKGGPGRDHHMRAFSGWMAGAGVRAGITHGATDDLGYRVAEGRVHVNDLHATMLHLLGLDHERLTVRAQGRDFRLTDVAGRVVREVLA
jgi:hypothetical protein